MTNTTTPETETDKEANQTLRSRSAIESKLSELKSTDRPETPEEERGVFDLNAAGLQYDGKIAALNWLLKEPRSEVDVYMKFREARDSATTTDIRGAKTGLQMHGKTEILRWALQTDSPKDPRTVYEHVDEMSSELFNLLDRVRRNDELTDSDLPESGDDVDLEQLHEELRTAYRAVSDARLHMINGPEVNQDAPAGNQE